MENLQGTPSPLIERNIPLKDQHTPLPAVPQPTHGIPPAPDFSTPADPFGGAQKIKVLGNKDATVLNSVAKAVAIGTGYTLMGLGVVGAFVGALAFSSIGGQLLKWPVLGVAAFCSGESGEMLVILEDELDSSGKYGGIAGGYLFSMASAKLLAYAKKEDYQLLFEKQKERNEEAGKPGNFIGQVVGFVPGFLLLIVTTPITLPLSLLITGVSEGISGAKASYEKGSELLPKKTPPTPPAPSHTGKTKAKKKDRESLDAPLEELNLKKPSDDREKGLND